MSKLRVKFLVDKEKQRVVYAEAGSDFVDVLFSFLVLPLGRIVKLLGKQSGMGSLDSLYQSVELLDEKYLQSKACKEMLLNPRSAAALICEDLKIKNIHDSNPRDCYYCVSSACFDESTHYFTFVENIKCCRCGNLMTKKGSLPYNTSKQGGIFVQERIDFLVTDDLRVMPNSLMGGFSILKEMGFKDASMLEERVIDFGTEEALNLLRKSLVSKNLLSEVCFSEANEQASVNCSSLIKKKLNVKEEVGETTLKLILNRKKNDFLYAEAGDRFSNQLFSFLTFPLGSVLRLLSDNMSVMSGCISNLYSSVDNMSLDYFQTENCRNMLLTPKLATFYGFEQQILNFVEISSQNFTLEKTCCLCFVQSNFSPFITCQHQFKNIHLIEQNPKSGNTMMFNVGAYVSKKFMVADNLNVSPLSSISAIINDMNLSIPDLVEKDACLDKAKALSILSAMLISNTVLTDVFCPKLM